MLGFLLVSSKLQTNQKWLHVRTASTRGRLIQHIRSPSKTVQNPYKVLVARSLCLWHTDLGDGLETGSFQPANWGAQNHVKHEGGYQPQFFGGTGAVFLELVCAGWNHGKWPSHDIFDSRIFWDAALCCKSWLPPQPPSPRLRNTTLQHAGSGKLPTPCAFCGHPFRV